MDPIAVLRFGHAKILSCRATNHFRLFSISLEIQAVSKGIHQFYAKKYEDVIRRISSKPILSGVNIRNSHIAIEITRVTLIDRKWFIPELFRL
jgi:hypothetical protein